MTRSFHFLSRIQTRALRVLLLAGALLACALQASRPAAACSTLNIGDPDLLPPYIIYPSLDGRFQFRAIDRRASHPGTRPGMYRSDDLEHPLWTADWSDAVQIANDGVHVVRMYFAFGLDDPAFALYERDWQLATFRVKDLVTTTAGLDIPVQRSAHFRNCGGGMPLRWLKDMEFDDAKGLLLVTTVTGEQVSIALGSGEILRRSKVAAPKVTNGILPALRDKVVTLQRSEKIHGMVLPPGTVVDENGAGTWIKSAMLSQSAEYRGIRLAPGTRLNLSNADLAAEIVRRGRPRQESDKDNFADMEVTSLESLGEFSIGKLRVSGLVFLMQGLDGLAVSCMTSQHNCRVDDQDVYLAEFWPDLSFRHLELKSGSSQPLRVQVGDDVLRTYDVWYWPNGQVNLLSLKDGNQRFRGKVAGPMLRFWEDGSPQWWADNLYCRNGNQAGTFSLPPGSAEKAVAACADHSIYYVPREALCNAHPELAIQRFDFLRNRRPSVFQECREPLPHTVMAEPYAVSARYVTVFVQAAP